MQIRSDNVSGTITCLFGFALFSFGFFGLFIVGAQRLMFSVVDERGSEEMESMTRMFDATQSVFLVYLPFMAIAGVVFAIAGYYIRRGSNFARRIARLTAVLGYAWGIAYTYSSYQILQQFDLYDRMAGPAFKWFSLVTGAIFLLAAPSALLFVLSRPSKAESESLI